MQRRALTSRRTLLLLAATVATVIIPARAAHASRIDWTTSDCDPNTKMEFGWLVTWNNIRPDPTEAGTRVRPTKCSFWDPTLRATVDDGPIPAFHVIFTAEHVVGPHPEDENPNPNLVRLSVLDPHLFPPPMPGQKRQWFLVDLEGGGANPGAIEHPTTLIPKVDHFDNFGLWALTAPGGGAAKFWFSGVHCSGAATNATASSQICEPPQPPPIPEPHTIVLVGAGLIGLVARRRRQQALSDSHPQEPD